MSMRALGILIMAALVAARADDGTPAPDPLATAKNELAALKAAPPEAPAPSSTEAARGPSLSEPGAGAPAPLAEAPKESGKGSSWLLDAMLPSSERKFLFDGTDALQKELELLRSPEPEGPGAAERGARVTDVSPPARPSVVNPLDAFMDGWISAHDKDLLRPAPGPGSLLESLAAEGGNLEPRAREAGPPANPYLAGTEVGLTLPLPDGAALNPPAGLDSTSPNAFLGPETKPIDEPKLALPDFTQPGDDEKYFKQLKRF